MTAHYVDPWDVNPGDTVWNGKGTPGSPATVLEVREPSHGVANAYGAVVLDVVYDSGHPGTLTRFPHDGKILCERKPHEVVPTDGVATLATHWCLTCNAPATPEHTGKEGRP